MTVPLRVAVRVRPVQPHDGECSGPLAATPSECTRDTLKAVCDGAHKEFVYDHVFGPTSSQHEVFTICALPLVDAVLSGMNGCIFAFGQTGAGKTHSMLGSEGGRRRESQDGILPRAAAELFRRIARLEADASHAIGEGGFSAYEVRASFIEVYRESAFDLLGSTVAASRDPSGACTIREHFDPPRVYAEGAAEIKVTSVAKLLEVVAKGAANRATAATGVHAHSSRSHALLILSVEHRWRDVAQADEHRHKSQIARLTLVDLAGAESMERSHGGAFDAAGVGTNMGLLVLGRVIHALAARERVPYRDSTLTRLLQTSLGGTAVTQMLACVSPAAIDADQTLRTLQYAASAHDVRCTPEVARVREELDNNPMIGDVDDEDALLNRRAIWIETDFGDIFARCVGDPADPLILYVHGSGPCNSSMFWNKVIMDVVQLAAANSLGMAKSFFHVAIDCPNYGRSPGDKQTIRSYPGALVASILRALGRKSAVAMCGSSQGCASIFNASLEFPKLTHSLAVVHPVAHAPQRFTSLALPTLLIFDTEDAGHPVSVGRQMRRYLPNSNYFEFTRSKDGDWEADHFGEELIALLAPHWQDIKGRRGGGRPDPKLPDLTRVTGGFRAWNEAHGREWTPMMGSGHGFAAWANDAAPEGDNYQAGSGDVWRAVLDPGTNMIQYEHVSSGRLSRTRPVGAHVLVERLCGDKAGRSIKPVRSKDPLFVAEEESEDEEDRFERLQQEESETAAEREREATQLDCDMCGNVLIHPVRLARCRCALCACCVERTVQYTQQCPVCGMAVEKKGGTLASQVEGLSFYINARLANPADPAALRFQDQVARFEEMKQRRAASHRIILEYGNTAKPCGNKVTYVTFLKTSLVEVGPHSSKNPVVKVDFNINPGYSKPTTSVQMPDLKSGAVFEYSMARRFPCFITVHFQSELHLPSTDISFCVQDVKSARRIIIEFPSSGSSVRRPKKVDFEADPPRNGWISFVGAAATPEVTYLSEAEAEPVGKAPKAKAGAKAKGACCAQQSSMSSSPSPGPRQNQSSSGGSTSRGSTPPTIRHQRSNKVKDAFAECDTSGALSAGLDCDSLAQILMADNSNLTYKEVQTLFGSLEQNEHGKVCFQQVCDLVYGLNGSGYQ